MIGILCSNEKEEVLSQRLNKLFKILKKRNDDQLIVFTILNIDFLENTVTGSLISERVVKVSKVALPSVIFNLSVQLKTTCIKARKRLENMEKVKLVNNVNRFDQSMIMEILQAADKTSKHILPYYLYDKDIVEFKFEESKEYIEIPLKGTGEPKVIYRKSQSALDKLISTYYQGKNYIHVLLKAVLFHRQQIIIEVPKLANKVDLPIIIRTYVQKYYGKSWVVLGRCSLPEYEFNKDILFKGTDEVVLDAINHINNYMPSLGACFIDLLVGSDGENYFLRLGGIREDFFDINEDLDFYKKFYENLIKFKRYNKYV